MNERCGAAVGSDGTSVGILLEDAVTTDAHLAGGDALGARIGLDLCNEVGACGTMAGLGEVTPTG
jgi:hypothetical protein